MTCGSAPVSGEVLTLMRLAMCCDVIEGWISIAILWYRIKRADTLLTLFCHLGGVWPKIAVLEHVYSLEMLQQAEPLDSPIFATNSNLWMFRVWTIPRKINQIPVGSFVLGVRVCSRGIIKVRYCYNNLHTILLLCIPTLIFVLFRPQEHGRNTGWRRLATLWRRRWARSSRSFQNYRSNQGNCSSFQLF